MPRKLDREITSSYTVEENSGTIRVDTSGGHVAVYLPPLKRGNEELVIQKTTTDRYNVSLVTIGGAKIDGNDIFVFGREGKPESLAVLNTGGNWAVVREDP